MYMASNILAIIFDENKFYFKDADNERIYGNPSSKHVISILDDTCVPLWFSTPDPLYGFGLAYINNKLVIETSVIDFIDEMATMRRTM